MGSVEFNQRLGAAIERAAESLPDGWQLVIDVERGAGSVSLLGPDGYTDLDDFAGDDLADSIENAVAHAISEVVAK